MSGRIAAEQVAGQRGGADRPPGPEVAQIGEHREHQPPVPPQPVEAADRRFAGGQGVALHFHVQEELRDDADERAPQQDQPDLRGDERPQHELARRQADAAGDDAGADQAPVVARRLGHVAHVPPGRSVDRRHRGLGALARATEPSTLDGASGAVDGRLPTLIDCRLYPQTERRTTNRGVGGPAAPVPERRADMNVARRAFGKSLAASSARWRHRRSVGAAGRPAAGDRRRTPACRLPP